MQWISYVKYTSIQREERRPINVYIMGKLACFSSLVCVDPRRARVIAFLTSKFVDQRILVSVNGVSRNSTEFSSQRGCI